MLTMCLDKFVWRCLMEVNAFPLDRLLCELCRRVWSEVGRTLDWLNSGLMNALNGHWQVAKDACNLVIRNKTARITTAKMLFFVRVLTLSTPRLFTCRLQGRDKFAFASQKKCMRNEVNEGREGKGHNEDLLQLWNLCVPRNLIFTFLFRHRSARTKQ